jgi:hypothetical protein
MLPHTTDEMGIYLRKIAKTPLLSRDNALATVEKVCQTRRKFLSRLLANDYSLRVVLTIPQPARGWPFASLPSLTWRSAVRPPTRPRR